MVTRRDRHPGRCRVDGEQSGSVAVVGDDQDDVGRGGVGQRRELAVEDDRARRTPARVGRGPLSGPTVAIVEPSAMPASEASAASAPKRVRARAAATAVDSHGPGMQRGAESAPRRRPRRPSSCPRRRVRSSTRTPVAPSAASPLPHVAGVVPVGSSSSGRTCPATLAFSARKRARCRAARSARRSVRGSSVPSALRASAHRGQSQHACRRDALVDLGRAAGDRERARAEAVVGPSAVVLPRAEDVVGQDREILSGLAPTRSWPGSPSRGRRRRAGWPRSPACTAARGS